MKKFIWLILGIFMLSLLFAGCTSQSATPTPVMTPVPTPVPTPVKTPVPIQSITGSWDLVSYNNGQGGITPVLVGTEITANFEANWIVSGSTGCNQYSAGYTTTASNGITIAQPIMTLMACPTNVMQQETQYLTNMQKATNFAISGDQLTLTDLSGTKLLTYKKHVSTPVPIVGSWNLFSYNNGKGAIETTSTASVTTAIFSSDNKLTGFGGCNQYSATYSASGQSITISQVASTKMACDLMQQETQYFSLLPTAATYETSGDQLTIFNSAGTKILIYKTSGLKVNPL